MKCIDLINELKSFSARPIDEEKTCDTVKAGDPEKEVRTVAVSMFATPDVVRKAVSIGADMLIVHEPSMYLHLDDKLEYPLSKIKKSFLDESGLVIFRFHDFAHSMAPDIIYDGELTYLGLKGKRVAGKYFAINRFELDEEMTAAELAGTAERNLGIKNVRIAGSADKKGKKISCCFGTPGHVADELYENDFVLTGEICEWREGEMARDYAQLGYNKAIIVMGHIGSERAGMMLLAEKLTELHPEIKTEYIECGELYSYTK